MAPSLSIALRSELISIVGESHLLTGSTTSPYAIDWTGRFIGSPLAVVRPQNTEQVARLLKLCSSTGIPVVPQGGNTGLVGGGVPLHGELVLSLRRLNQITDLDLETKQVTAGAGATLTQLNQALLSHHLELPISIASRDSATIGGMVSTNAGGLRVFRHGHMRAHLRGIQAVRSSAELLEHLTGFSKDNTGYDYPSLLCGAECTLAVLTAARLALVPTIATRATAIIGCPSLEYLHNLTSKARNNLSNLESAEFFTETGLQAMVEHFQLNRPFKTSPPYYLLLETSGPTVTDELSSLLVTEDHTAHASDTPSRNRLWSLRERYPEVAGLFGETLKLDVTVPLSTWVDFTSEIESTIAHVDPHALTFCYGHLADGNVHVNIVPHLPSDGRHQQALFSLVASHHGSISAEHGVGALKGKWLHLSRSPAELRLFSELRAAFDPPGILNPHVLPRDPSLHHSILHH